MTSPLQQRFQKIGAGAERLLHFQKTRQGEVERALTTIISQWSCKGGINMEEDSRVEAGVFPKTKCKSLYKAYLPRKSYNIGWSLKI
ncbi:hypothetical protein VNO80_22823 [Phaseolus coccineus]|uniref:Uncharacterized protein n=1 Tax=Phaseolus coccineus TaxID=3886 RepID=A0AAN9QUE5_PHACN